MKLKDIKKILDKLSKQELEQEVFFNSEYQSGVINSLTKLRGNLYYTNEDDPVELYTMKELKEKYDTEEIENFETYFSKGSYIFNLNLC